MSTTAGHRRKARTTVTVAILLAAAWYTGKALGQHRRARRRAARA
jgi:hypothetical protein